MFGAAALKLLENSLNRSGPVYPTTHATISAASHVFSAWYRTQGSAM